MTSYLRRLALALASMQEIRRMRDLPRVGTPHKVMHAVLVYMMAWIGFVFWLPEQMMRVSPTYYYFDMLMPEWLWGSACVATAAFGAALLSWGTRNSVTFATFMLASAHGTFALLFLAGAFHVHELGIAPGSFSAFALTGYYLCWRASRDLL